MAENFPNAGSDNYGGVRRRFHDAGLLVIPVAGPPGTQPEIVRVHAGVEYESVDVSADGRGAPPTVPHPVLLDTNNLLLNGEQEATIPQPQPEGCHYWSMKIHHFYVHRKLVGLAGPFPTGLMPFEVGSPSNNTIPATAFSQAIIGADSPPLLNPIQGPTQP